MAFSSDDLALEPGGQDMPSPGHLAILLLLVVPATATSVSAQSLDEGVRVRLHQWGASPLIATPERLSADTLWVSWGGNTVLPIPRTAIDRLEVRTRSAAGPAAIRWAVAGLALGGALGALVCASDMPECKMNVEADTAREAYLWNALGTGLASSAIGALAGILVGRDRWEERNPGDLAPR